MQKSKLAKLFDICLKCSKVFIITDTEKVAYKRIQIVFTDNSFYH